MKPPLLYLTADWPWPALSGGRAQAARLAELLAEWFEVTVLAADHEDARYPAWTAAVKQIRTRRASNSSRAQDALFAVLGGRQVLLQRMIRSGGPRAAAEVGRQLGARWLVVGRPLFDGFLDAAPGATLIIEANEDLVRATRSMSFRGVSWRTRLVSLVDAAVVGRQQRRNYPRADAVLVCSEVEERLLASYVDAGLIRVLPNTATVSSDPIETAAVMAVAFVGSFGYPPNEAAALELGRDIMPAIRAAGGPEDLILVGSKPGHRIRNMVARESHILLLADVENTASPLRRAGVLVAPIRHGAGTRVKILEAMAAGVPVVSTRFGIEGLDLEPGKEVLVANSPDEFAAAVVSLQQSADFRRRVAESALLKVQSHYSPGVARTVLSDLIKELDGGPGATKNVVKMLDG